MEAFQSLIQIYVSLIVINIFISAVLWRVTRSQAFLIMTIHWIIEMVTFYVSGLVAGKEPVYRTTVPALGAFLGVYTLALILAKMIKVEMPLRKFIWIPFVQIAFTLVLNQFKVIPEVLAIPEAIAVGSCFYYIIYHALRYRRQELTFSQWALVIVYAAYAIHFFDFPYFYVRFELLMLGFTIAMVFHYIASILVPTAIVEHLSKEKSRLETELKYKAQLTHSAKMAALGEMAGGVAHEINTPLTTATLLLDQIQDLIKEENPNHPVAQLAKKGQTTLHRISRIVSGLLTFSREDRHLNPTPVKLNEVIEETLVLCQERIHQHQIKLHLEIPSEELYVMGFLTQLSQVLLNVLNNSVDALANAEKKEITIRLSKSERVAELSVIDTGVGIDPSIRERIFDPFFTTKEIGKGTGLGLSVSKGIIESHGGKLFLSPHSEHTCFLIVLPLMTFTSP